MSFSDSTSFVVKNDPIRLLLSSCNIVGRQRQYLLKYYSVYVYNNNILHIRTCGNNIDCIIKVEKTDLIGLNLDQSPTRPNPDEELLQVEIT